MVKKQAFFIRLRLPWMTSNIVFHQKRHCALGPDNRGLRCSKKLVQFFSNWTVINFSLSQCDRLVACVPPLSLYGSWDRLQFNFNYTAPNHNSSRLKALYSVRYNNNMLLLHMQVSLDVFHLWSNYKQMIRRKSKKSKQIFSNLKYHINSMLSKNEKPKKKTSKIVTLKWGCSICITNLKR